MEKYQSEKNNENYIKKKYEKSTKYYIIIFSHICLYALL